MNEKKESMKEINQTENETPNKKIESKIFPILSTSKELAKTRVQQAFWEQLIKKHVELIELAYLFNLHPDKVFELLKEYDEELKK